MAAGPGPGPGPGPEKAVVYPIRNRPDSSKNSLTVLTIWANWNGFQPAQMGRSSPEIQEDNMLKYFLPENLSS